MFLFWVKLFSPWGIIIANDEHVFLRISVTNLCVLCFGIYAIPTICTQHYQSSFLVTCSPFRNEVSQLHWNFFGGRIDFCDESHWVIESSRTKYLQDSRPESFWYYSTILYIYVLQKNFTYALHMAGLGEKTYIYKQVMLVMLNK